ncbi:hypothetical protein MBLNU230_g5258t1 [Neophaeotheca triangularis]
MGSETNDDNHGRNGSFGTGKPQPVVQDKVAVNVKDDETSSQDQPSADSEKQNAWTAAGINVEEAEHALPMKKMILAFSMQVLHSRRHLSSA